jgi:hypothetical protein
VTRLWDFFKRRREYLSSVWLGHLKRKVDVMTNAQDFDWSCSSLTNRSSIDLDHDDVQQTCILSTARNKLETSGECCILLPTSHKGSSDKTCLYRFTDTITHSFFLTTYCFGSQAESTKTL